MPFIDPVDPELADALDFFPVDAAAYALTGAGDNY